MKKALAYVATAVLLGFLMMMLPLAMQIGSSAYQSPLSPSPQSMNTPAERDTTKGADNSALQFYAITQQPSNLLPSSLVFFSGLIVALTTYVILKKRMP
jgi:hypothetical protein